MEAMKKYSSNGKELPATWQSSFELGELSKASEISTAAVMRLVFPFNRTWLEAHCKPPMTVTPDGKSVSKVNAEQQKLADGIERSLLAQQHLDFGLKARVELSVKEALHHGCFVATTEWETQNKVYDGQGLESLSAPVWVPHSMWNCWPDMSPAVVSGANIFYPGSMMIKSFMRRNKVLALKGDGYMNLSDNKIPKRKNTNKDVETEDIELVTYYGDLVIPREDGDIYLPNSKAITANGTIIYYAANPLPFPEVIYQGYERQDVRDPYYTSPLIKNSPMQKMTTILANQFIDGVQLHTIPPGTYDGNDAYLVQNGGPSLHPGAMTPSKGSNKVTFMPVGDPKITLAGVQFGIQKIEEGTGVNAIRAGATDSDRKTATEVRDAQQGGELRSADFAGKLESGALRPFLYMQHELNLKNLDSYSFYCAEKGLPDFITVKRDDLPKVVHFEIVGSKGVLGEERRRSQMTEVTAFASGNPLFAPLLNAPKILMDMYEDAGVKGAEEYIKTEQGMSPEAQQKMQVAQQQMQQMQQQMQQMAQELQKAKAGEAVQLQKLEMEKAKSQGDMAMKNAQLEFEKQKALYSDRADKAELMAKIQEAQQALALEAERMNREFALEAERMRNDLAMQGAELRLAHEKANAEMAIKHEKAEASKEKKKRSTKITRTSTGYEVEE